MSDPVALSVLPVLQLEFPGVSVEQLASRYANDIVLDYIGRRCLPRDRAREIILDHRARAQQLADQRAEQRAERRRRGDPIRRRITALRARQQVDIDGDLSRSALATLMAEDASAREASTDRRMAEFRNAELTRHSFRTEAG